MRLQFSFQTHSCANNFELPQTSIFVNVVSEGCLDYYFAGYKPCLFLSITALRSYTPLLFNFKLFVSNRQTRVHGNPNAFITIPCNPSRVSSLTRAVCTLQAQFDVTHVAKVTSLLGYHFKETLIRVIGVKPHYGFSRVSSLTCAACTLDADVIHVSKVDNLFIYHVKETLEDYGYLFLLSSLAKVKVTSYVMLCDLK